MTGATAGNVTFYLGTGTPNQLNTTSYDPAQDPSLTPFPVSAISRAPNFFDRCPNLNDAALLLLARPHFFASSPYAQPGASMPTAGTALTTIGFGVHDSSNDPNDVAYIGAKFSATENVVAVTNNYISVNEGSGLAVHGDSGGPLFFNGTVVGDLMCTMGDPGHLVDYYQRVDQIAGWMNSTINTWDGNCRTACANAETACGTTCPCLRGYDLCLTNQCGDYTPITFFCRHDQ
jgi:hypothetical protein